MSSNMPTPASKLRILGAKPAALFLAQRNQRHADVAQARGVLERKTPGNGSERGGRLGCGDSPAQPPDSPHAALPAGQLARPEHHRRPDVDASVEREVEARRQHADHGEGLGGGLPGRGLRRGDAACQQQCPTQDPAVSSEMTLPVGVAEERRVAVARLFFLRQEEPAELRLDAEEPPDVHAGAGTVDFGGELAAEQRQARWLDPGDPFEDRAAGLLIRAELQRRERDAVAIARQVLLPEHDQAVFLGHRQPMEEDRVGDAKDRDREADPQAGRQHRKRREQRPSAQQAEGIADVLPQLRHVVPSRLLAAVLALLLARSSLGA
ncbi:MAG TPA: hypothetical protein VE075_11980 [Thermoanaerobaculia bacterium]|nr:hypothetical protein [Thermoanaerobaculia bacterium]